MLALGHRFKALQPGDFRETTWHPTCSVYLYFQATAVGQVEQVFVIPVLYFTAYGGWDSELFFLVGEGVEGLFVLFAFLKILFFFESFYLHAVMVQCVTEGENMYLMK